MVLQMHLCKLAVVQVGVKALELVFNLKCLHDSSQGHCGVSGGWKTIYHKL